MRATIVFVILLITISKTTILCDDTDFQDVCLEYANNISAKFNTSLKFVDLKAENPYMQAHKWAKISYIHLSTKPELPHKLPSTRIVEIFQEWFDNPGRFEETTTLSVIHEANYTFELQTSNLQVEKECSLHQDIDFFPKLFAVQKKRKLVFVNKRVFCLFSPKHFEK